MYSFKLVSFMDFEYEEMSSNLLMPETTSFTEKKDVFSSEHHRVWLDIQPLVPITKGYVRIFS